jgi:hypothetical protein
MYTRRRHEIEFNGDGPDSVTARSKKKRQAIRSANGPAGPSNMQHPVVTLRTEPFRRIRRWERATCARLAVGAGRRLG